MVDYLNSKALTEQLNASFVSVVGNSPEELVLMAETNQGITAALLAGWLNVLVADLIMGDSYITSCLEMNLGGKLLGTLIYDLGGEA